MRFSPIVETIRQQSQVLVKQKKIERVLSSHIGYSLLISILIEIDT